MIHAYPQSKASKGICYSDVQMPSFTLFYYISTSAIEGQTELFLKVTVLRIRLQCILQTWMLFLESKRSTAGRGRPAAKLLKWLALNAVQRQRPPWLGLDPTL